MVKTFDVSEAILVKKHNGTYPICPDCKNHEQGEPSEYYDCKNIFIKDGQTYGQCMCYSIAHGRREE